MMCRLYQIATRLQNLTVRRPDALPSEADSDDVAAAAGSNEEHSAVSAEAKTHAAGPADGSRCNGSGCSGSDSSDLNC